MTNILEQRSELRIKVYATMTSDQNGNAKIREVYEITEKLKDEVHEGQRQLRKEMSENHLEVMKEITRLKTQASIWGAVAGLVWGIIASVITAILIK